MKKMISLLMLMFVAFSLQSQIISVPAGGAWNDPNTWIGGIVPGEDDDVIITSDVVHQSAWGYDILTEYCKNLTITSTGKLANGDYSGGLGIYPLVVYGNVINNGIVENGDEDCLKLFITGDLTNNNLWQPYQTEFQTQRNHKLSLAEGKYFGSKIINSDNGSFTALTNMIFSCGWDLGGVYMSDHFILNGDTLYMENHTLEMRSCMINSGKVTGDFEIHGIFKVGYDINDTLTLIGKITVADTLVGNIYNAGYGKFNLKVIGNLTNNGLIKDDYDADSFLNPDDLNILVTGDIINNGTWSCNFVTLAGTSTQTISQSTGKEFDSYFEDLYSNSDVLAQSDLTITKDFNLNGATLQMDGHRLNFHGWLKNGFINNAELHNGYLQDLTSLDNFSVYGRVTVDDNNEFRGSTIIFDTLQANDYNAGSYVYALPVKGDIINQGVIRNSDQGDFLSLEVSGDITNNGIWQCGQTLFTGTADQTINQAQGKIFQTNFSDVDTVSKVTAASDIKIIGEYNLMNSTLEMDNHELEINGKIHDGHIISPKLRDAVLLNTTVFSDIEIRGIVVIEDGNIFRGNMIVTDTLQSQVYGAGSYTYILDIYGRVVNNGVIRNEPIDNEALKLVIHGDIINNGKWTNSSTVQRFYPNDSMSIFSFLNSGITPWEVGDATITGGGAASFSIISGGTAQNVAPADTYDLTLLYIPTRGDSIATLTIPCDDLGTLNSITLIGHTYNTPFGFGEGDGPANRSLLLYQNSPNPCSATTRIKWHNTEYGRNELKLFDAMGREILTLVDQIMAPGEHACSLDASRFPAGVYFYRLRTDQAQETRRMVVAPK